MPFFFGDKDLDDLVNKLPQKNITVRALKALDFVAPGQWNNTCDFDELVRRVTNDTDEQFLADVRKKAIELYDDKSTGYKKAFRIYQRVDDTDKLFGAAALGDKLGGRLKLLSFVEKITPRADTTQSIDLAVKVVSEMLAYVKLNGIPGNGIKDFTEALDEYGCEAKIRIAALVAFDGIIPLGPDFIDKVNDRIGKMDDKGMEENTTFQRIKGFLPSGISSIDFIQKAFGSVSGRLGDLVDKTGMNRDMVIDKLQDFVEISDDKLDYLGAFLDLSTNYFEHTGLQTVAIKTIEQAANEA